MSEKLDKDESFEKVISYYSLFNESTRLTNATGKLELIRTQDILTRYLPKTPVDIADIGGGPGVYASWLASFGHTVKLIDPVQSHIDHAIKISNGKFKALIGDARQLKLKDSSVDIALLMGPLYHLMTKEDRIRALQEAYRVLRPSGMIFAVGISRFASALDGLQQGLITNPEFAKIVENDLKNGQHHNSTNNLDYFTDAYLHLPDELASEVVEAQFNIKDTLAIEGMAWLLPNLQYYWENESRQQMLLKIIRVLEKEPTLIGASAHFMVIAKKC